MVSLCLTMWPFSWNRAARCIPLAAWCALVVGCTAAGAPSEAEEPLTILYTADAQGYLEECACETGGMLGEIARRAALVDSLRRDALAEERAVLLVEAGDFATGPGSYGELAGYVAAQAMSKMGYDAVLPGEVELNLGPGFWDRIEGLRLPFVHTNFGGPELGPPQPEPLVLERGGRRVAVLGLLGTDLYLLPEAKRQLEILPPDEAAAAALRQLEGEDVDLVVALVHMKEAELERVLARNPAIGVIVAGHTSKNLQEAERRGDALYVTGGFLGQHLGTLRLAGPELEQAESSAIRLETTLPEDPQIARWVDIAAQK